jgi:hypothetical protein
MVMAITLIHEGRPVELDARVGDDAVHVSPEGLASALGWKLEAHGLCYGDVCVPVRDPGVRGPEGIDLGALARAIGRPFVLDAAEGVAAIGSAAADRAAAIASLEAPDFELPDLAGRRHRLSEHRGKRAMLLAWASW